MGVRTKEKGPYFKARKKEHKHERGILDKRSSASALQLPSNKSYPTNKAPFPHLPSVLLIELSGKVDRCNPLVMNLAYGSFSFVPLKAFLREGADTKSPLKGFLMETSGIV